MAALHARVEKYPCDIPVPVYFMSGRIERRDHCVSDRIDVLLATGIFFWIETEQCIKVTPAIFLIYQDNTPMWIIGVMIISFMKTGSTVNPR